MKKIEAIMQPDQAPVVQEALNKRAFSSLTTSAVETFDHKQGHTAMSRGTGQLVHHEPKVKIELLVRDEQLEAAIETIEKITRNGKVFVVPAEEVY